MQGLAALDLRAAMIFVHAADLHLDSPLRGLWRDASAPSEILQGATRRAFSRLVDLCVEERARVLFLAGDLFDGDWRDHHSGLFLARELRRLREAGVETFAVRGNHDASNPLFDHLAAVEGCQVFAAEQAHSFVREELGLAVHGQSYARHDVRDNLAAGYPPARSGLLNVGLLHTALDGRAGHESYAPCHLGDLRALGYDYWALGHVHGREIVARDPWVVFPGNLQARHAREPGPKGCALIRVEDARVQAVEWREVDVLRFAEHTIPAASLESIDELLEAAREAAQEELAAVPADRRLALGLRVEGATAVHEALQREAPRLLERARMALADLDPDRLWLHRLQDRTQPAGASSDRLGQDFLRRGEEALEDPELHRRWERELELLRRRLPPELLASVELEGEDPARSWRSWFGRARPRLRERLLGDPGER